MYSREPQAGGDGTRRRAGHRRDLSEDAPLGQDLEGSYMCDALDPASLEDKFVHGESLTIPGTPRPTASRSRRCDPQNPRLDPPDRS